MYFVYFIFRNINEYIILIFFSHINFIYVINIVNKKLYFDYDAILEN